MAAAARHQRENVAALRPAARTARADVDAADRVGLPLGEKGRLGGIRARGLLLPGGPQLNAHYYYTCLHEYFDRS